MSDTALESIKLLPEQIKQTWEEALRISFDTRYRLVDKIVIAGMGGSIYNAYLVESMFAHELKVPVIKLNTYEPQHFVNEKTLFIASSYSGTTEEVVYNLKKAHEQGARCAVVTAGGALLAFAQKHTLPHYHFNPVNNPSNQPRMGQGYMLFGVVAFLQSLGLLTKKIDLAFLDEVATLTPEIDRSARMVSKSLVNRELVFVAADHLSANAHILRNQTNETAKLFASYALIPELNHHLMEGLKNPHDKKMTFIFINSAGYLKRNQERLKLTQEVVVQNKCEVLEYVTRSKAPIAEFVEVLMWGGYLTYYLAQEYGEEPNNIPWVDYFKKKLGTME